MDKWHVIKDVVNDKYYEYDGATHTIKWVPVEQATRFIEKSDAETELRLVSPRDYSSIAGRQFTIIEIIKP